MGGGPGRTLVAVVITMLFASVALTCLSWSEGAEFNCDESNADCIVYQSGEVTVAVDRLTGSLIAQSSDATEVIQTAIDLLSGQYPCLYIRSGTYHVRTLYIREASDIVIRGDYGSTILKGTKTYHSGVVLSVGEHDVTEVRINNVTIANLVIDGDYPTRENIAGLDINGVNGIMVRGIIFQNCGQRALRACTWSSGQVGSTNVQINDCIFNKGNIVLGGIDGGHLLSCTFDGTPIGNTVIDMSYSEQESSQVNDFWIRSCSFTNIGGDTLVGIIAGYQHVMGGGVVDCVFRNIKLPAVIWTFTENQTYQFEKYLIEGNELIDAGGIFVLYGNEIIIRNNRIRGANDTGVMLGSGSSKMVVEGNTITESNVHGIYIAATNCVIKGNNIQDNNRANSSKDMNANLRIDLGAKNVTIIENYIMDTKNRTYAITNWQGINVSLVDNTLSSLYGIMNWKPRGGLNYTAASPNENLNGTEGPVLPIIEGDYEWDNLAPDNLGNVELPRMVISVCLLLILAMTFRSRKPMAFWYIRCRDKPD